MGFEGVKINKLNGGLGRSNSTGDNIVALVAHVPTASLPAGFDSSKAHLLLQASDADLLGFTAAQDANKKLMVKQNIESFFQYAPEALVYLMVVTEATPALIAASAAFNALLRSVPDVKGFGVIGTTSTVVECAAQAEDVQGLLTSLATEHRLIDFVLLEGVGVAAGTAISEYPNLREQNAPNVSVVIAQDLEAAALDAAYKLRADVGSALGMLAIRKVNENLGSVNIIEKPSAKRGEPDYPLSIGSRYAKPALSDGKVVNILSTAEKNLLSEKGYIFSGSYEGYGGVFFNSSPTAVQSSSDYAFIENNRVWNKAARHIRTVLLPEIKGVVKKDPTTGYIKSTTITRWSGLVNAKLESMVNSNEISGFEVYIDPKQILNEQTPLQVKAQIVMDDIVHEIEVGLGLTNKIV